MESDKFDNLVRRAFQGASRRGVLRVGVGALAASALTAIGLQSDNAEAKKKNKKITICENGESLRVKKKGWQKKHPTATKGACIESFCPEDRPVECGAGCCPSNFSKCCDNVEDPVFTTTCNPTSYTCCPASAGGGSCPPENPQCCPTTLQRPNGSCVAETNVCCTTETGGGSCPAEEPVCCLIDPEDLESGNCCPAGSACCTEDADCGVGGTCNLASSCCDVPAAPRAAGRRRGRGQGGAERFHMVAR